MSQPGDVGNTLQMAEALLAQLPMCAVRLFFHSFSPSLCSSDVTLQKAPILDGISSNSCGLDVGCLCTNDAFLLLLQGIVLADCSLDEGNRERFQSKKFNSVLHAHNEILQKFLHLQILYALRLSPALPIHVSQ